MTERKVSKIKFVGLHAHSGFSIFDGLGYPDEHMDFAYSNGSEALALTDHGNCNGLSYQVLHAKKMKKEGKDFKPIYGCEMYFHPSIAAWRKDKEEIEKTTKAKKEDEEITGAIVENEEETKKTKKSILNRRSHLVLLAQNQKGLNNLFTLISKSYSDENYYRFPRIDYEMLKQFNEGIIGSSACLTGDSVIETSQGQMRLDEMIDKWKMGEELCVLSYSEKDNRVTHKKVLWGDLTRKEAKIIKITLKDGKSIRLTPDHKVYTDKGWVEAGELKNHKEIKILSLK
jgi:DNA polymerase III alpha subunit